MNRKPRPPQFEPCARCRAAVAVTDRTARSRYTSQPLCDRCATGPSPFDNLDPYPSYGRLPKSREQLEAEVVRLLGPRPSQRADREHAEAIADRTSVVHRIAHHEAGHAIVARALGLEILEVVIDERHGGINRFPVDAAPDGWSSTDNAAVLMAGTMAERAWCPASTLEGNEDDESVLRTMLDGDEPPDVIAARATVERILAERAGEVEALAEALIKHRTLTGDQVEDLIAARPVSREDRAAHPGTVTRRHATWVEYSPDDPPAGWDRATTVLYNDMHQAGDREDWTAFRRLQRQLAEATAPQREARYR